MQDIIYTNKRDIFKMLTYEQIKEALQTSVVAKVAREAGVNRNAVSDLKNGHEPNITRDTQRKLSDYLKAQSNDR